MSLPKKGSDKWLKDLFGDSNISNLRDKAPDGLKGVWTWGKEFFDINKIETLDTRVKLLASARHFAKLITRKPLSVRYSEEGRDESYTDGHSIVISSNISQNLDSTIGLVCHEASHIELTNFNIIKLLMSDKPEKVSKVVDAKYHNNTKIIKVLHNIVEDRRIDQWVYASSPGFRVYYKELYKRYFMSPLVNEMIKAGVRFDPTTGMQINLRDETLQNYMFYLTNIMNPHIKKDELKGLQEIWDCLNLYNIQRLTDTKQTLDVAVEILDIILKHIPKEEQDKADNKEFDQGDGEGDEDAEEFNGTLEDLLKALKNGSMKMGGSNGKPMKLSDELRKEFEEHMKKQKDFLAGQVDKGKLESGVAGQVETLSKCTTAIEHVKEGNRSYKVLTVDKVNAELVRAGIYSVFKSYSQYDSVITEGLQYGQLLGKRLKVRTEERELVTTNLKSGKIDKSKLAGAGFGSENLFFNKIIDKTQNGNLHISLDISGSMDGTKWKNTLKTCVAIAKACSMIQGVRCQISLRYSDNVNGENMPIVINFYDSNNDGPSKLRLLSHVSPEGATPEGICYGAMMNKIMAPILNSNTLFINFSDGLPGMYGIGSDVLIQATKKNIQEMKNCGVKVLSYYIEDGSSWYGGGAGAEGTFKLMYGEKESKFIDVNELNTLAKTINNALLKLGTKN